jgi:tRNA G37 N-methylase Trm5
VTTENIGDRIDMVYDALEGCEDLLRYHNEHGTPSLLILTQFNPGVAREAARLLRPDIEGKRVVEVGAGVGLLAIEMAKVAASVVAIEVDPAWSWVFTRSLYRHKPPNLTWIFGTAESVAEWVRGDVAVVFTRSGQREMEAVARRMAPKVLMPMAEGGEEDVA